MSKITIGDVASELQKIYKDYSTGKLIHKGDVLAILNESFHQIDEMLLKQQKQTATKRVWTPGLRMELRTLRLKRLKEIRDFINKGN